MRELERVLAGPDALLKRAPGVADVSPSDEGGPPGDRLGRIGTERIAELGQREAAVVLLMEEAERGQCTKQAVKGSWVRLRCRGELVARSRAVGQQVRDPEHGGDMDRLR